MNNDKLEEISKINKEFRKVEEMLEGFYQPETLYPFIDKFNVTKSQMWSYLEELLLLRNEYYQQCIDSITTSNESDYVIDKMKLLIVFLETFKKQTLKNGVAPRILNKDQRYFDQAFNNLKIYLDNKTSSDNYVKDYFIWGKEKYKKLTIRQKAIIIYYLDASSITINQLLKQEKFGNSAFDKKTKVFLGLLFENHPKNTEIFKHLSNIDSHFKKLTTAERKHFCDDLKLVAGLFNSIELIDIERTIEEKFLT